MLNQIKKFVVFCVIFAVILSMCPAYAAENSELETAITTVKSKIDIPEECTEFESGINSFESETEYDLSWNSPDSTESVRVCINDKGDITRYRKSHNYNDEKPKFAKLSIDALTLKALEWITAVNPNWTAELKKSEDNFASGASIHSDRAYIYFDRYMDGIKFLNDYVSFSISNQTGEIISMSAAWTYTDKFSNADGILSEEEALEKLLDIKPLELKYSSVGGNRAELVYETKNYDILIDAYTGEKLVNTPSNALYQTEDAAAESGAVSGGSTNKNTVLSEKELAKLEEIGGLLSKEALINKAVSLKYTDLDKATVKEFSFMRGYRENDGYYARITFVFNEREENEYAAYILLDAKNGALEEYRAYNYNYNRTNDDKKVDLKNVGDMAAEFASLYSSEQFAKTKPENIDSDNKLCFVRYENGIPYPQNYISVKFDLNLGRVTFFGREWDEVEFENADNIIDASAAKDAFLTNIGFELVYEYSYTNDKKEPEIKLAYKEKMHMPISAKSGEAVSQRDEKDAMLPSDISGHYAEDKILALLNADFDMLLDDGSFAPDTQITYKEFGQWVSKLMLGYAPKEISELKSVLIDNDILYASAEFMPDAHVLRIDGPTYILRALGYGEIADLHNIYKCDFVDADEISTEKIGYAAIAKELKIVSGDENSKFNPNESLTRADAAVMLYNYLARNM